MNSGEPRPSPEQAAERILALAAKMIEAQAGGVAIKEDLSGAALTVHTPKLEHGD